MNKSSAVLFTTVQLFSGKLSSKAKSDNQSLAAWASDMIEDFYKSQKTSKNLIIEVAGVLDKLSLK